MPESDCANAEARTPTEYSPKTRSRVRQERGAEVCWSGAFSWPQQCLIAQPVEISTLPFPSPLPRRLRPTHRSCYQWSPSRSATANTISTKPHPIMSQAYGGTTSTSCTSPLENDNPHRAVSWRLAACFSQGIGSQPVWWTKSKSRRSCLGLPADSSEPVLEEITPKE